MRAAKALRGRRPVVTAANALGVTTGQLSTTLLALVLAAVLTLGGLVPVLRNSDGTLARTSATGPPSDRDGSGDDTPASSTSLQREGDGSAGFGSPTVTDMGRLPAIGGDQITTDQVSVRGGSPGRNRQPSGPTARPSDGPTPPPVGSAVVFASVETGAPDGLAVTDDGKVWVATGPDEDGVPHLLTYSAQGRLQRDFPVAGHAEGSALGLTGLAALRDGSVLGLDASTARVLLFDAGGDAQQTLAVIPDIPPCRLVVAAENGCEAGLIDQAPLVRDVAVDQEGTIYITDTAQGTIWRISDGPGRRPEAFATDTAWSSDDGLSGIAVADDGSLLVASPQAIDPASAGGGALYRIRVSQLGPESKELVTEFGPGEAPSGVASGKDGSIVVTLRDADEIVVLDSQGNETRRIGGQASGRSIDAPAGVAFFGPVLLVANRAPESPEDRAVLSIGIE